MGDGLGVRVLGLVCGVRFEEADLSVEGVEFRIYGLTCVQGVSLRVSNQTLEV